MLLPPSSPSNGTVFYFALKTLKSSTLNTGLIKLRQIFRPSRVFLQAEKFFYLKK